MRKALFFVLVACSGCSLVLDDKLGDLEQDSVPDMQLHLIDFEAHENQRTEVLLVNDTGFVQGHAVLDPLPGIEFTVVLENRVAPDVRRVDFWSDLNEDGELNEPMRDPVDPDRLLFEDHMWRDTLDELGRLDFVHNTNFDDIVADAPARFVAGSLSVTLSGADDFEGQFAEVFVRIKNRDVQVGYYRLGAITGGLVTAELDGIIDDGTVYIIEVSVMGGDSVCAEVLGDATGAVLDDRLIELADCSTFEEEE